MGLIIRVKDADFSKSGLPKLRSTRFGFLTDGLIGLYLFDDGAVDSVYSMAIDNSGEGNHAPLRGTWTGAIRKSFGVQCGDNGVVYECPTKALRNFTWIVAAKTLIPNVLAGGKGFPRYMGTTGCVGTDPAAVNSGNSHIYINTDCQTASNASWGVQYNGGTPAGWPVATGTPTARMPFSGAATTANSSIAGISLNTADDVLLLMTSSNSSAVVTQDQGYEAMLTAYTDPLLVTHKHTIGAWRSTTLATIVPAELYLAVIYNRALSPIELANVMGNARSICTNRGIVIP